MSGKRLSTVLVFLLVWKVVAGPFDVNWARYWLSLEDEQKALIAERQKDGYKAALILLWENRQEPLVRALSFGLFFTTRRSTTTGEKVVVVDDYCDKNELVALMSLFYTYPENKAQELNEAFMWAIQNIKTPRFDKFDFPKVIAE